MNTLQSYLGAIKGFLAQKTGRWVAAITAVAVVAAGGIAAFAFDQRGVELAGGYGNGDGYNRFVLTLMSAEAAPVGAQSAKVADNAGQIDITLVSRAQEALGSGGSIVVSQGRAYYLTDKGAMDVSKGGDGTILSPGQIKAITPTETAEPAPSAAPQDEATTIDPETQYPTPDPNILAALRATPGVKTVEVLPNNQVHIAATLSKTEVKALKGVAAVEESVQVPVMDTIPSDPYFAPYAWSLKNTGDNAYLQTAKIGADISATKAWDVTQGQGTVVAVVDTGFYSAHEDLAGALWSNPKENCGSADTDGDGLVGDCHGWNFYTNSADITNGVNGTHGTTVSGAIAARMNNDVGSVGVAPQAKIMPLVAGGGSTIDVSLASKAIRYAVDHGANVINASFGGAFTGTQLSGLSSAVDYAYAHNVLVVASSGNDAANRDTNLVYPASLPNPGVLTVGSTDAQDNPASTSAYGAKNVDVYAPGEKVFTTWDDGGYKLVSGTSIAAPHVAGAIALYLSVNPGMTADEQKAAIMNDSTKLSSLTGKCVSGGRLSLAHLTSAGNQTGSTVSYGFSKMVATAGSVAPEVAVTSNAGAGTYSVTLGLGMKSDSELWALSGQPITLNGVTVATDDNGEAVFNLGTQTKLGNPILKPSINLPEGDYALTAQIFKDGEAMTRPYAAPLNVSAAPAGGSTPSTGTGGSGTGSGSTPSTGTGGGDGSTPSTGTGGGSTPSTGTGGGSTPSTGTGGSGTGSGSTPSTGTGGGDGSTPSTGTGGGSTPSTGTGGGSTPSTGGSGTGGGSTPSTGTGGGSTPSTGTGGGDGSTPSTGTGGGSTPSTGGSGAEDRMDFNKVGQYQVTSILPHHVGTSGGAQVTLNGLAFEDGVTVRVGPSANAHTTYVSPNVITFSAPALLAGTYDVTVYKNGQVSSLPGALIYTSDSSSSPNPSTGTGGGSTPSTGTGGSGTGSGSTPSTGTGGNTPSTGTGGGSTPSTGTGGSGAGSGSTPSTGTGGGSTPSTGTGGSGTGGGSTPSTGTGGSGLVTKVGPHGERLVQKASFSSLSGLWSLQCSSSCSGIQI